MKKFHYIYKVVHIDSKKEYIGIHSTNNLDDGYFANGVYCKKNKWVKLNHGEYNGYQHIKNAMLKYGRKAFNRKIIEFCKNRKELMLREEKLVNEDYIKNKMTYNIRVGGKGGQFTKEVRERISKNNSMYRDDVKKKVIKSLKKRWEDENLRELFSKNNPMHNMDYVKKISGKDSVWFKRKHKVETIDKIKESVSQRKVLRKQIEKAKKSMLIVRKSGYEIKDKKTGKSFHSLKEIIEFLRQEEDIKIGVSRLMKCIKGERAKDLLNGRFIRTKNLMQDNSVPRLFLRGKNYNVRIWNKKKKKYWKRSLNTQNLEVAKSKLNEYFLIFKDEQKNP